MSEQWERLKEFIANDSKKSEEEAGRCRAREDEKFQMAWDYAMMTDGIILAEMERLEKEAQNDKD